MAERGKYALLFAFWGDWFADVFLRYSLASLLFRENLPSATADHDIAIKIATTRSCRRRLDKDPRFAQVCRDYVVEILTFPDEHTHRSAEGAPKYSIWASMLNPLIESAVREGRGMLFLHPDSLYPDGFLPIVIGRAALGKKLLFTAGVRVSSEHADKRFLDGGTLTRPVSGREFEMATIGCLHEFVKCQYWSSDRLSFWPSALFLRLDENYTAARFFDMHPIYVDHSVGNVPIGANIDVDYDTGALSRLVAAGKEGDVDVLACENGYFLSLTPPGESWATRLIEVGDDASAPLGNSIHPASDGEKFLHVARWGSKYVPLKKAICFQPVYLFRTGSQEAEIPRQRLFELNVLGDTLLGCFPLFCDRCPAISLELSGLGIRIDV